MGQFSKLWIASGSVVWLSGCLWLIKYFRGTVQYDAVNIVSEYERYSMCKVRVRCGNGVMLRYWAVCGRLYSKAVNECDQKSVIYGNWNCEINFAVIWQYADTVAMNHSSIRYRRIIMAVYMYIDESLYCMFIHGTARGNVHRTRWMADFRVVMPSFHRFGAGTRWAVLVSGLVALHKCNTSYFIMLVVWAVWCEGLWAVMAVMNRVMKNRMNMW